MDGGGDGTHLTVGDEDLVDRAKVGDLGGGAGEEGLVADVEHFARERLFDDLDAELLGEGDDGIARDAGEGGVGQRWGVEYSVAHEEEVLARAFGEIAVDIERDAFGVTVDLGLHADELRVHVVGACLGERRHGIRCEARPGGDADVGALIARDVFAPGEVGDVDLNRGLERVDADLAVAAKSNGANVTRGDAVGFDHVDDGGGKLLRSVRKRHAVDLGGVGKAAHVLRQAEDARSIAPDAFEDGGSVVDNVRHDMNIGLVPRDEVSVVPDVLCGCDRHEGSPVAKFRL